MPVPCTSTTDHVSPSQEARRPVSHRLLHVRWSLDVVDIAIDAAALCPTCSIIVAHALSWLCSVDSCVTCSFRVFMERPCPPCSVIPHLPFDPCVTSTFSWVGGWRIMWVTVHVSDIKPWRAVGWSRLCADRSRNRYLPDPCSVPLCSFLLNLSASLCLESHMCTMQVDQEPCLVWSLTSHPA